MITEKKSSREDGLVGSVVLVICDGWGCREESYGNAILSASTPRLDSITKRWPSTTIDASGEAVGLPRGQMGNSEVGHLTIGCGRVKLQPLSKQIREIEGGGFYKNETLRNAFLIAKQRGSTAHIFGLLSDGGVHSYGGSAIALVKMAASLGLEDVSVHIITDGRDTAPRAAADYVANFEKELLSVGIGRIASIAGRYYAMDRDNRWDRTSAAYDALVLGSPSIGHGGVVDYIKESYLKDIGDEFIKPTSIPDASGEVSTISDDDVVVAFNFRPDRMRQIFRALCDEEFRSFNRKKAPGNLHLCTMAEYDASFGVPVAFPDENLNDCLAEIVSRAGLKQLHIAETEKYAHVTYFMNGGREEPFKGESRELVPSPRVSTYDLCPEMSAPAITKKVVDAIKNRAYDFIIVNYANADMVGHTGVYDATVLAIEAMDNCVADVIDAAVEEGGVAIVTADHGNAEYEIDSNGGPVTSHTSNPVPFLICGVDRVRLRTGGSLQDVAPTVLDVLGLDKPSSMTGDSLLVREKSSD